MLRLNYEFIKKLFLSLISKENYLILWFLKKFKYTFFNFNFFRFDFKWTFLFKKMKKNLLIQIFLLLYFICRIFCENNEENLSKFIFKYEQINFFFDELKQETF